MVGIKTADFRVLRKHTIGINPSGRARTKNAVSIVKEESDFGNDEGIFGIKGGGTKVGSEYFGPFIKIVISNELIKQKAAVIAKTSEKRSSFICSQ